MKKTIITSLVGLVFATPAYSAEKIELDDVVVTASRIEQPLTSVIGDVTVIGRKEIERAGTSSLTILLSRQPGVQITTNGGAGKTSSVFLRGTNSNHVVVLVDGLRINSATTGTTSFENIPLAQIEKIEILRGPASSLYGADAIGGVIQIFTKRSNSEKPLVHAAIGLGSYNTKTAEAGVHGALGDTRYGLNVSSFDTNGFSALRALSTDIKDADDDGYNNLSVSGHLEHTIVEGHSLGINFFQSKGHNNFDSASSDFVTGVLTGDFDDRSNQTLQSYALTSKNKIADTWFSTIKLGVGIDDTDSYSESRGKENFRTKQDQLSWQHDFTLPVGTLTFLYDHLEQKVTSANNFKDERSNDAFMASYLADYGQHTLHLSLREDHNSSFGNHTTGGVGYGFRITPAWRVAASYGSAFKAPTFNELFFPFYGNPDIAPEKSDNVETSIKYETSRVNLGLTVFENKIRNLIAYDITASSAGNINKAKITGATFDGSWNITDYLLLSGNFTVQSPRDDESDNLLARRGNRYGAINLLHNCGDFQWGAEVTGASARYNDSDNTQKLSGYMLVNLTANYLLNPEWKLETRANNILDKNYALALSFGGYQYNNPGTNLFVGLRYDMKP